MKGNHVWKTLLPMEMEGTLRKRGMWRWSKDIENIREGRLDLLRLGGHVEESRALFLDSFVWSL